MAAPRIVLADPPADPILTVEEVRAQLRLSAAESDETVEGWIAMATRQAENYCSRRLVSGHFTATFSGFPAGSAALSLAFAPITEITGITYLDADGETVAWGEENYTVAGLDDALSAEIYLTPTIAWPTTHARSDAVSVAFVAETPPEAKAAVLLYIGSLDAVRANMMVEKGVSLINTRAAESLLDPYRIMAL